MAIVPPRVLKASVEFVLKMVAFLGTPVCSPEQFAEASMVVGHVAAPQHALDVPEKLVELSEQILYSFEGFEPEVLNESDPVMVE